jgi:hypothetical protein
LKIAVCVFLFKDKTYGLLDVYEESARGGAALLVVGHSALPKVRIVLECRTLGAVTC